MDCVLYRALLVMDCVLYRALLVMDCVLYRALLVMDCVLDRALLVMDCVLDRALLVMDCVLDRALLVMDCVGGAHNSPIANTNVHYTTHLYILSASFTFAGIKSSYNTQLQYTVTIHSYNTQLQYTVTIHSYNTQLQYTLFSISIETTQARLLAHNTNVRYNVDMNRHHLVESATRHHFATATRCPLT